MKESEFMDCIEKEEPRRYWNFAKANDDKNFGNLI